MLPAISAARACPRDLSIWRSKKGFSLIRYTLWGSFTTGSCGSDAASNGGLAAVSGVGLTAASAGGLAATSGAGLTAASVGELAAASGVGLTVAPAGVSAAYEA